MFSSALRERRSSLGKRCLFCGRFFVPDPRVGERQKACPREPCKKKRKAVAQRAWCENNPGYFQGRYPYVKQWRQQKKSSPMGSGQGVIQDKIPLSKPCLRLILLIPADKDGMIQDEILLRRQSRRTFVADGYG
jgi:hypothetical protein